MQMNVQSPVWASCNFFLGKSCSLFYLFERIQWCNWFQEKNKNVNLKVFFLLEGMIYQIHIWFYFAVFLLASLSNIFYLFTWLSFVSQSLNLPRIRIPLKYWL